METLKVAAASLLAGFIVLLLMAFIGFLAVVGAAVKITMCFLAAGILVWLVILGYTKAFLRYIFTFPKKDR